MCADGWMDGWKHLIAGQVDSDHDHDDENTAESNNHAWTFLTSDQQPAKETTCRQLA